MAKKSHFLKGVLIGGVIGAAAALFAAPKKGSELREDAVNTYNDFKEDPQAVLTDLKDFSADKFNEVKDKFDSGEYSAEKAKEFLLDKGELIRSKVESGELSSEAVKDFFSKTKDSLTGRFSSELADKKVEASESLSDYSWTESSEEEAN